MAELRQSERILKILQWLSAGNRMTTADLQYRLDNDVSIRTIQRDMELISGSLPLQVEKGKGNQNTWMLDRRTLSFIPSFLESNEYLAAVILKQNLKIFQHTTFQKEVNALLKKLNQLVPEEIFEVSDLMNVYDHFTVGEYDYSDLGFSIEEIFKAIQGRHPCKVVYQALGMSEPKGYLITPAKIFQYRGALYVAGYIHAYKKFIALKLSRLRDIEISEEVDSDIPEFDTNLFREGKFGLFSTETADRIIVRFDKDAAPHISGRQWHPSQTLASQQDGSVIVELVLGITPELESWILSWVPYVQILEPNALRHRITDRLSEGLKILESSGNS